MNSRKNVVSIKLNCIKWSLHIEKNSLLLSSERSTWKHMWDHEFLNIRHCVIRQWLKWVCCSSDALYAVFPQILNSLCYEDICKEPSKIICLSTSVIIKCSHMLAQVMTTICSNPWLVCPSPQITNLHMSSKIPITSWFSKAPYE